MLQLQSYTKKNGLRYNFAATSQPFLASVLPCPLHERHDLDDMPILLYFALVIVSDYYKVVAFQFSCTFCQTVHFSFFGLG